MGCLDGPGKVEALGGHGCVMQSVHITCTAPERVCLPPHPHPGDTGQCLGTCVIITTKGAPSIEWVGARDAAQHPTVPRIVPSPIHTGLSAPKISGPSVISVPELTCCVFGNVMGELAKTYRDDRP